MAKVTCSDCGWSYDDTYRLTYCAHRAFRNPEFDKKHPPPEDAYDMISPEGESFRMTTEPLIKPPPFPISQIQF